MLSTLLITRRLRYCPYSTLRRTAETPGPGQKLGLLLFPPHHHKAPTLPSGYIHFARVGAVRTQSATNYYPLSMTQKGRIYQPKVATGSNIPTSPVMATASTAGSTGTPTWVEISTSSFVPPTASRIHVSIICHSNSTMIAPNNLIGSSVSLTNPPYLSLYGGTGASVSMTLESGNIYWATSGGGGVSIFYRLRG